MSAGKTKSNGSPRGKGKAPGRPTRRSPRVATAAKRDDAANQWNLRLYVAGQSPKSMTALNNLKRLCEHHLPGQYTIEVIDLLKNPQLAQMDQILAIPTLVRKLPEPMKRVIGDLTNTERTMVGLDLSQLPGVTTK